MIKKTTTTTPREYTAPKIRVSQYEVSFGLCLSVQELDPVYEEDAGIELWED